MTAPYVRRALSRLVAFAGAITVTSLLLALQVGILRGASVAAIYLGATLSPLALVDALLIPSPRSGPGRLGRILLLFALLFALSAVWQWRALAAVPSDLQLQIVTEVLMRNITFLGAYLLLEAALGSMVYRRIAA